MSQFALALDPAPADTKAGTHAAWQRPQRTSREGAEHVQRSITKRQADVVALLRRSPQTIHDIATALSWPDGSASARIRELVLQGKVKHSGKVKRNEHSGINAVLWECT